MLSKDDVIAKLAKEHNILISRDDPLLAFISVQKLILNEYNQSIGLEFETAQQNFQQSLLQAQEEYQNKSKELANQIIGKTIHEFANAEKRIVEHIHKMDTIKQNDEKQLNKIECYLIVSISVSAMLLFLLLITVVIGR